VKGERIFIQGTADLVFTGNGQGDHGWQQNANPAHSQSATDHGATVEKTLG
jgi:hypothetical protein